MLAVARLTPSGGIVFAGRNSRPFVPVSMVTECIVAAAVVLAVGAEEGLCMKPIA